MKKLLLLFLFICPFAFAKDHQWQDGKLVKAYTDGGSAMMTSEVGNSVISGPVWRGNKFFVVSIDGVYYTLRGKRIGANSKDLTEGLIVGDPVKASVEGSSMIIVRNGDKDLKLTIISRER